MIQNKQKWFLFKPERKTAQVATLGLISIMLSFAMNVASPYGFLSLFLRDILQISLLGILIPLFILNKSQELKKAGIRFDKAPILIPISILLGLTTFFMITGDLGNLRLIFKKNLIGPTLYVMVANIYEVLFFFIFIRYYMEKAFGILPALILAAAFYSLHHAGFQPEFQKLFIVGIVYISIFRLANNWLICFPMWWAGGLGDVLFQSEVTHPELISGYRAIIPAIAIILSLITFLRHPNLSHPQRPKIKAFY